MDFTEATGIHLKNVQLIVDDTKPVVNVDNSRNITFDNLKYNADSQQLFNITGTKTAEIKVTNTNTADAKTKAEFGDGASAKVLTIN